MASPADKASLSRLADLVVRRRTALGLTKISVANAAGITITTYRQVEGGQSVRDTTYGKIEGALGWAAGSCMEVLRGSAPAVIEPGENGSVVSPVTEDDLAGAVDRAVSEAAIATTELGAAEIRKLKQRVLDELRRAGKLNETDQD